MSRLPDLERALFDAATRLDAARAPRSAPAPPDSRHARRWRRGSAPLLAGLACLVVAGGAVAAVSGLLANGDPVPDAPRSAQLLKPVPGTTGFTLAGVRAADPAGGPDWGIGTYVATATVPTAVPAGVAAQLRNPVTCVVIGRVQAGQLGVVGRDGAFANDGRFHRLPPTAQSSGTCGGRAEDGSFFSISTGPPIPASGDTGPPGTTIGGCRERVNLDGPTVSAQTRRRLRNVPQCSVAGLRRVIAGFAGPRAASATLTGPNYRQTLKLHPEQNGAYLFVTRFATTTPGQLSITDRAGNICKPFSRNPPRTEGSSTKPPSTSTTCLHLADPGTTR